MTTLSKKCQYALRCVLELAGRYGDPPVSVSEIAGLQAIPRRFLELIIKELKQAGFVNAHRGVRGGYTLTRKPNEISVGEIIELIEGPQKPVDCQECDGEDDCPLADDCAWAELWRRTQQTVQGIYGSTSFQQLLEGRYASPLAK